MKTTILLIILFYTTTLFSQKILTVKDAEVQFEASVPVFEPVAAKNTAVQVALNTKRGYISFVIPMNQFIFERSLMQEHFNAYYLETDRYPRATFKGIIEKFNLEDINNTPKKLLIKGKIKIHGESKAITTIVRLQTTNEGFMMSSDFVLNTDDFNIEIPFLIRNKISKTVIVKVYSVFPTEAINIGSITINTKSKIRD
ncbi:YceI family protein [Flavobacterium sp. 7A]|uniref:YceI family protein n=1 Tax=Flavobacterium sp. 7A TaxID=2940571 RepID=UPI00222611AF|nr:YceI family protein [Flavobacterium sp. 7A]MCW2119606.1 polyisoprenoid-binding protein YceI [Flavobacterium sp. 7A]